MASLGCCTVDELRAQLNDRQRIARTVVGVRRWASRFSLPDAQGYSASLELLALDGSALRT